MGKIQNTRLPLLFVMHIFASACEQNKPPILPRQWSESSATISSYPSSSASIPSNGARRPVYNKSSTRGSDERNSNPLEGGGSKDPSLNSAGIIGDPHFPPQTDPIPTDDDLGLDDSFFGTPFIPISICGNGIREIGEQCDDKNVDNKDGCTVVCQLPYCGNGVTEENEECDDNNHEDGDGCSALCEYERCGNERIDQIDKKRREQCDDGNFIAGDGCSPCCMFEICGNSIIDTLTPVPDPLPTTTDLVLNEQCDDGNLVNGDGCNDCCKLEVTSP